MKYEVIYFAYNVHNGGYEKMISGVDASNVKEAIQKVEEMSDEYPIFGNIEIIEVVKVEG